MIKCRKRWDAKQRRSAKRIHDSSSVFGWIGDAVSTAFVMLGKSDSVDFSHIDFPRSPQRMVAEIASGRS